MFKLRLQKTDVYPHGHRLRMRDRFVHSFGFLNDTLALEMLLNGYFSRCDTRSIAKDMLKKQTLCKIIECSNAADPCQVKGVELYMGVCSNMIIRAKHKSQQDKLPDNGFPMVDSSYASTIYRHFISPDPQFCYICLNALSQPVQFIFSRFGDPDLPLALECQFDERIRCVILAFPSHTVPKDDLIKGIIYYLEKIDKCAKNWFVSDIMLIKDRFSISIPYKSILS